MDAELARALRDRLVAGNETLTQAQRLDSLLRHNRLVVSLYRAGERLRAMLPTGEPGRESPAGSHGSGSEPSGMPSNSTVDR